MTTALAHLVLLYLAADGAANLTRDWSKRLLDEQERGCLTGFAVALFGLSVCTALVTGTILSVIALVTIWT